jgi:fructose-bisphosphate aldolase class 1
MAMMDRLRGHIITAQGFDETFGSAILFLNTLEQTISFNGNEVLVPEVLKQLGIQVIAKTDAGLASPDALGEQYGKNNLDKLAGAGGILQQIADRNVVGIKQRLVVVINDQAPTNALLKDNAELMAQCAKLCQQTISQDGSVQGMVAMSEPEILRTGTHDINTCFDVWCRQIEFLKESYAAHQVDPSCVVIKTSLITPSDRRPQIKAY